MPTLHFTGRSAVEHHHLEVPCHPLVVDAGLSEGGAAWPADNLVVEGDNLLVLKALLPTHAGRVKCAYLDPPYNTGSERWVFNDNLTQPRFREWIGRVVGPEGEDANRHDKWCCMIYPRLRLLHALLREDGALFASIDDNEVHHLRLLLDEVFGPANFVADITVVNNLKGRSDGRYIATAHEHLLFYRKSAAFATYGLPLPEEYHREYAFRDERGAYRLLGLRKRGANSRRADRPNLYYPFYYDEAGDILSCEPVGDADIVLLPRLSSGDEGNWRWGRETAEERLDDLVVRKVARRGEYDVFQKDYLSADGDLRSIKPKSFWLDSRYSSDAGTRAYKRIVGDLPFPNPKPPQLIQDILRQATRGDDLVLDPFAGSGTTGQAVLALNREDGGRRRFVLVQAAQDSQAASAPANLCAQVTAERVRRAIRGYTYPTREGRAVPVAGLGGSFTYARVASGP